MSGGLLRRHTDPVVGMSNEPGFGRVSFLTSKVTTMTMTTEKVNHTPGPWEYDSELTRRDGDTTYHSLFDANNLLVANVPISEDGSAGGTGTSSRGSEQANARLIAAGPDMLEALRETVDALVGNLVSQHPNIYAGPQTARDDIEENIPGIKRARAAIAKATETE